MQELRDEHGQPVDKDGRALAPLTREQALIGPRGVLGIKDALRSGVDPEAIGGTITVYRYDPYHEDKERNMPISAKYKQNMRNVPLYIEEGLSQVGAWLDGISREGLRMNKSVEWYFAETSLADASIRNAIRILATPYAGQSQWCDHKGMTYEKHAQLVAEAGHWLLHDGTTLDAGEQLGLLTLSHHVSMINLDPFAEEELSFGAVRDALRDRFRHMLDQTCGVCEDRTFRQEGKGWQVN